MAKTSVIAPLGTYAHHERHWHYVRRRRTRKKTHTSREILAGQLLSVSGSVLAGYVLDLTKLELASMAGVFVLLPGVFDLGGSVAGAMGARLNHRLSLGAPTRAVLRDAILHAFLLLVTASLFLGLIAASIGAGLFHGEFIKLFAITVGSAVLTSAVGLPVVALATLKAFRRGVDPDNFIGPIETSIFDTLTILCVTFMVVVLR
jgi:cation transporter-like permease